MRAFLTVAFLLSACSSSSTVPTVDASSDAHDAVTPVDASSDAAVRPEGGTVLGPCSADHTCSGDALCVYPEGSCTATPVCVEQFVSQCKHVTNLVGCDGGMAVGFDCNVGEGHANAPTPPRDAATP